MSFLDNLVDTQNTGTNIKTPVQPGGGFLNNLVSATKPSAPAPVSTPRLFDSLPGPSALSTPQVAKPGTPDLIGPVIAPVVGLFNTAKNAVLKTVDNVKSSGDFLKALVQKPKQTFQDTAVGVHQSVNEDVANYAANSKKYGNVVSKKQKGQPLTSDEQSYYQQESKRQQTQANDLVLGFMGGEGESAASKIAKSTDTKVISTLLKTEIPGITEEAANGFSNIFKNINDPQSVDTALNRIKLQVSQGAKRGMVKPSLFLPSSETPSTPQEATVPKGFLENIPPNLQPLAQEAQKFGYEVKMIDKTPKDYAGKHFSSSKTIEIYTKGRTLTQIQDTLTHEIGHIVDYQRRGIVADPMGDSVIGYDGKLRPAMDSDIYFRTPQLKAEAEAIRAEDPKNHSLATTQKEIYADAYKLFKQNPEKLQKIAPTISKQLSDFYNKVNQPAKGFLANVTPKSEYIPGLPSPSKSYFNTVDRNGKAFMATHATGPSGFNMGGAFSPEEKLAAQERSMKMVKELQSKAVVDSIAQSKDPVEIAKILETTGVDKSQIPQMSRVLVGVDNPKKVNNIIEGFRKIIPTPKKQPSLPPELEQKKVMLEIKKEEIKNSPYNKDNRLFMGREGGVRELGDVKNPQVVKKMEDRIAESGVKDPALFARGLEKFIEKKAEVKKMAQEVKVDLQANKQSQKILQPPVSQEIPALSQPSFDQNISQKTSPGSVLPKLFPKTEVAPGQSTQPLRTSHIVNSESLPETLQPKQIEVKKKIDALNSDIKTLESSGLNADKQRKEVNQLVNDNKMPLTSEGKSLKISKEGIPLALTQRQKNILANSPFLHQKIEVQHPPVEGSYAEVKSVELLARQAESLTKGLDIPPNVTMNQLLEKTVTPVQKKVHFIDTFLRTPDRVMTKIGFGVEAKDLRRAMDSYWKELPKNLEKIGEWAKQVSGPSNKRIFKYLDGQAVDLNPVEQKVADEIRTWLQEWADRLGLNQDQRVSDYITRIFDGDKPQEFDEELAKIISDRIPGSVYNPFTLRRLGSKGYKEDTWRALEAYVKRGTRKVYMDPVLERIQSRTGSALDVSNIEKSQFKFIQKYVNNINMRPTELDESIDNFIKSIFENKTVATTYKKAQKATFGLLPTIGQRPTASLTRFFRQMTFRGMIGLNLGSALRNVSQGINTYAILGEKYTTIGYLGMLKQGASAELEREGVLNAGFVQDKVLSATGKTLEKIDKGLFFAFDQAEKINRGSAYFGAKAKYYADNTRILQGQRVMPQDIEEKAIEYAKEIVRKTQFSFDSIDTPVGMQSDIVKTLLQFQTFTTKQGEFIYELAKDKNYAGLVRYIFAGLAFVYTIGQIFGMKPQDLLPIYRIGVPASLKFPWELGKAVVNAPDKYGNSRSLSQKSTDVGNSAVGLFPAGSQIKKSVEGYRAIQKGGSVDKAGRQQFEVGGTPLKNAQALLFGKYANSSAQQYFNGDSTTAAESAYAKLAKSPTAGADFAKIIKENPALARQILEVKKKKDLGITPADDKILNLGVANGARSQAIVDQFNKLKTNEEKAALWSEYVKKKIITKQVQPQVLELLKNKPAKSENIFKKLFGAKKADAAEMPQKNYYIRNNTISESDLQEAKAIIFGEVSNRAPEKQKLEAQSILNTAFNRMDEYRKHGKEYTLTQVLQMPNQYQAFQKPLYTRFKKGDIQTGDKQKITAIDAVLEQVRGGHFINNIGTSVSYVHKPDGRIAVSEKKLFK